MYGLRVRMDDGWLYVMEGPTDNMRVMTTESLEEAEGWAEIWRNEGYEDCVEVVEYL